MRNTQAISARCPHDMAAMVKAKSLRRIATESEVIRDGSARSSPATPRLKTGCVAKSPRATRIRRYPALEFPLASHGRLRASLGNVWRTSNPEAIRGHLHARASASCAPLPLHRRCKRERGRIIRRKIVATVIRFRPFRSRT